MDQTQIISIPILPAGMVNAYLIHSEAGCILIDTGIPGSELKIGKVLAQYGLKFRNIKLIVATQIYTDHAGSAAQLRELPGEPILAHQDDADFYSRKEPMTNCTTSWVGKLFLKTPAPHEPYEGFLPDIMMSNSNAFNLLDFGVEGIVRHTRLSCGPCLFFSTPPRTPSTRPARIVIGAGTLFPRPARFAIIPVASGDCPPTNAG